ncbi:pentapeptide repeat-containing protein [Blautia sp. NSJ-159]|uniref:pentapeptide repeat-containing protein n=1 Tax=unclassified Blautia TaxID=2648079 RepID=UPI001FD34D12|nr:MULTISPECIES: pentapeptide repeat-containing protein [unclassified Blautia]MCJ8017401.1 pentapeptide repeat-containing protein [Blautia sp. NSJ-159]MCJ8040165.1 pentapeptide repeat-containing protein [Blautia sp. NSJ-165]
MKREELQEILDTHKKWINGEYGGARADLSGADLRGADLREANLREADLREANLRGADLREANLREADLREANLREADLSDANLRRADLRRADLDFSCWPLWCGGLAVKVCKRIAVQLAYHFCKLDCDDPEYIAARNAILDFANQFHRVGECGKLEKIDITKAPAAGKQSGTKENIIKVNYKAD